MDSIDFGLVLNLHQPGRNLEELLDNREWEAKEILWALDRIPRSLWDYEDVGRVHLSLSGTLLETLADPRFQERVYGVVQVLFSLHFPLFLLFCGVCFLLRCCLLPTVSAIFGTEVGGQGSDPPVRYCHE